MPRPTKTIPAPIPNPDPFPVPNQPATVVTPATPVRQIGRLPVETWRSVLAGASSPMMSEVDQIVSAAAEHGAMCLAQAYKESSLGKDATARRTHNPYGIMLFGEPCTADKGEPVFNGQLCLRRYPSWTEATKHYRRIIADADPPYDPGNITLEEYLAVYVGGPGCRSSKGGNCANGETWRPGGGPSAGSINLYIHQTVDRINMWLKGVSPAPPPVDVLKAVLCGKPVQITQGWAAYGGPNLYGYGIGHGLDGRQHTGIDIGGERGWDLCTPAAGEVVCDGTDVGPGSWGTGCAAFNDTGNAPPNAPSIGAGRVEIMLDSGVALILGHSGTSPLKVGDRVSAGQVVATMGGMLGAHVHLETRKPGCQTYCIVNPVEALGGSTTPAYAPRVPFTEPADTITVTAKAGTNVYQRADPNSPVVSEPFVAGETFESGILTIGEDGEFWWVGTRNGRVRAKDCVSPAVIVK